jgi:hypothetical protein
MEATRLATTLTNILAPALPFLLTDSPAGQAERDEIPASALAADTSIWQKIYPKTSGHPALLEAAYNLARNSHDSEAQTEFHDQVAELLRADSSLFDDLKREVIHHFVLHHFDSAPGVGVTAGARA